MNRVLLLLAAVSFAACDTMAPVAADPDGPILPVAEGNTWTYRADDGRALTLAVGPAVDVEGERYHRLLVTLDGETSNDDEYVRAIGRGAELLYTAPLASGALYREATVYRYPVEGGRYEAEGRTYDVDREAVDVPAGAFEAVTYAGYDGDPDVSAALAPGVGIVRFHDGQATWSLERVALR